MDQLREVLRYHHYAIRTEEADVKWILQFIRFNGKRHPQELGKTEIEAFLSHLAVSRRVAASTQNQAFNAILFLYRQVLDLPVTEDIQATRSKKRARLPTVLSGSEVQALCAHIDGPNLLMSKLLYGSGMRVMVDQASSYTIRPATNV